MSSQLESQLPNLGPSVTVAERGAFCALDHVMSLNIENSKYLGIDCLRLPSLLMP